MGIIKRLLAAALAAVWMICGSAGAETVEFWNTEVAAEAAEVTFEGNEFVHLPELDRFLEGMPNLKTVNLWEKRLFLNEIPELMEHHPDVEFGMTIRLNESHILRTDMTAYSTLGRQPQIAGPQTRFFACLKHLKALDIGHMNVHSVDFLTRTAPLKILIIAIGYNDITDLSPLDGLQHLERLWTMGNWHLPEEEIRRFQALHPDCEVVTRSYGATGNRMDENQKQEPGTSWRHHPHYDTIHWIFDHSEYIGWDAEVPQVKTANDP